MEKSDTTAEKIINNDDSAENMQMTLAEFSKFFLLLDTEVPVGASRKLC